MTRKKTAQPDVTRTAVTGNYPGELGDLKLGDQVRLLVAGTIDLQQWSENKDHELVLTIRVRADAIEEVGRGDETLDERFARLLAQAGMDVQIAFPPAEENICSEESDEE